MTAIAVIGVGRRPSLSRLVAKLRGEEGIGLIELLIALLVLNIGIFATLGAFTSAATAINRASRVSTAAAISDKYMECFRDSAYASIQWPMTSGNCTATTVTGADGRQYNLSATIVSGSQYSGTYSGSTSVKKITLTITDPNDQNRVLVTTSSTFSRCTQSGMGSDPTACQS